MAIQPLNAKNALNLSIIVRAHALSAMRAAERARLDGDISTMRTLLHRVHDKIAKAKDYYNYAMLTGSLAHHYERAASGSWRALVRCEGERAWISGKRYAQRQSAQRAAGKVLARFIMTAPFPANVG